MATDAFGGELVEEAPKTDQFGGVAVDAPAEAGSAPASPLSITVHPASVDPEADPAEQARQAAAARMARPYVTKEMVNTSPSVSSIANAFSHGFSEGAGPEPLGFSQESMNWLIKKGIFRPDNKTDSPGAVLQAFAENFFYPAAAALDAAARAPAALYRGAQAAGVELGLHRDIVSIPDAFMGSPGTLHTDFGERPGLPEDVVKTIEEPPPKELPAATPGQPALKLVPAPEGGLYTPDQFKAGEKYFKAVDPDGNVAAEMLVKVDGKTARIEDILNPSAPREAGVGTIGNGQLLGLVRQFREQHPEVTELTGSRVSGARMGGDYSLMREPTEVSIPLGQARDLGVIGPEKPSIDEGTPAQAAAAVVADRAQAASQPRGEAIQGPEPGGGMDPWQQRFDQFVGKLQTGDDVKQLIRDSAKENGDFLPARQGDIPLSQVESIEQAAGVDPGSTDRRGLGRLLKNDNEVRSAMQVMLTSTENVRSAARDVKADGSPENLIKLQEAIMRRDLAVEQVVGMRAEWGRTGRVLQEFMDGVKDQEALNTFLKDKGRTPGDLHDIAHMVDSLDGPGAARFLTDARTPSFWDKYLFYWVNALISGPVTHAKYIGANAAFAAYEAGGVTPIAGVIGAVRRGLTGGNEGVFVGESAARMYGLLAGTPDALRAAARAARENIQVPLPGEVAKNVNPVINQKPNPIGGLAGTIIGIPSRGATGIHSFFNFLGYRAEIEAQAYRAAAKDGLSPLDGDAFWRRREELAANPTPDAMDKAIENGYHLTFIGEQGKFGQALAKFAGTRLPLPGGGEWQPFKLILPFTHIPGNILRGALEQTPAAFLDERMRADLTGKNGAAAQDTATARIIGGSVVSAMVVNWAINDGITGFGPTDPKERAIWLRTHEPYSLRVGGWWMSYNKFGSIGTLMGLTANLAEIGPKVKDGEYAEAAGRIVKATGRLMEDEVGMQGLTNVLDALDNPDNKMAHFTSSMAASNLPFSSALRQAASITDPYMRDAKTFVDQLRYSVPFARQDLLPKRDWLGEPLTNPGYGGGPAGGILRARAVNESPVDREITQLVIKPGPPQDRISGVKLTPQLYDEYQATAGALTKTIIESMISQPGWAGMPPFVREQAIHRMIDGSRKSAEAAMMARHPEIIGAAVQQRIDHITGASPTARPKRSPASLEAVR